MIRNIEEVIHRIVNKELYDSTDERTDRLWLQENIRFVMMGVYRRQRNILNTVKETFLDGTEE